MKTNVLVSIIMPSYKRKIDLVGRAIQSLQQQTYKNIEIVLVDDNGRDDLLEYRQGLKDFVASQNDARIVYLANEKNLGGSNSRNRGIEVAKGEYITFLDDDDEYLPNKIEEQLNGMLEANLDMSFTDLSLFDEKNKLIDYRSREDIKSFDTDYLFKYHLQKHITGTPTFMLKKNVLQQINGFDDVCMGQEFYLMSKIIKSECKIGYLKQNNIKAYRYDIEAISTGKNKIIGEKKLYEYKKSFFKELNFNQKKYIRCRHFAVLAVAYKRNHKLLLALWFLMIAVLVAPLTSIKEAYMLMKNKNKYNSKEEFKNETI